MELVVNWDDGVNVQMESVNTDALLRRTRELKPETMNAIAAVAATYMEEQK